MLEVFPYFYIFIIFTKYFIIKKYEKIFFGNRSFVCIKTPIDFINVYIFFQKICKICGKFVTLRFAGVPQDQFIWISVNLIKGKLKLKTFLKLWIISFRDNEGASPKRTLCCIDNKQDQIWHQILTSFHGTKAQSI